MRAMLLILVLATGCSVRDVTFIGPGDDTGSGDDGGGGDAAAATPELVVSAASVSVVEGATARLTVALATAPAGTRTVSITATAEISVDPPSLEFTSADFATPQTVTITPVADADFNFAKATISVALAGTATKQASVLVVEPGIVEVTPMLGTVCPGDSVTTTVRLRGDPLEPLTIASAYLPPPASTGDGFLSPAMFVLDSTNYATGRSVGATGGQDTGAALFDVGGTDLTAVRYRLTVRDSPVCTQ